MLGDILSWRMCEVPSRNLSRNVLRLGIFRQLISMLSKCSWLEAVAILEEIAVGPMLQLARKHCAGDVMGE